MHRKAFEKKKFQETLCFIKSGYSLRYCCVSVVIINLYSEVSAFCGFYFGISTSISGRKRKKIVIVVSFLIVSINY